MSEYRFTFLLLKGSIQVNFFFKRMELHCLSTNLVKHGMEIFDLKCFVKLSYNVSS